MLFFYLSRKARNIGKNIFFNISEKLNGIKTDIKKKKIENKIKIEETLDLDIPIPSGTILCHCFTCGSPVCSPMNWKDLNNEGSSLGAETLKAYQQKIKLILLKKN